MFDCPLPASGETAKKKPAISPEQNRATAISTLWPRRKTPSSSHVWSRVTNRSCVPMIAPSLYESVGFHSASVSRRTGGRQMLDLFSSPTPHR
jgi:hypothetical protein